VGNVKGVVSTKFKECQLQGPLSINAARQSTPPPLRWTHVGSSVEGTKVTPMEGRNAGPFCPDLFFQISGHEYYFTLSFECFQHYQQTKHHMHPILCLDNPSYMDGQWASTSLKRWQ
jgi:hypothetical protein